MKYTTLLLVALVLSACTLTRYYKTKPIKAQLAKIDQQMGRDFAQLTSDYALRKGMMAKLGSEGKKLAPLLDKLTGAFNKSQAEAQALSQSIAEINQVIGTRSKLESSDPAFAQVEEFQKSAKTKIAVINQQFAEYTKVSKEFNEEAQRIFTAP